MLLKINLVIILFFLASFSDPYAIKRISDANFRYEFYVTDHEVIAQNKKMYYWFKGGAIHSSESGTAGSLLHGPYSKMYHSNQLAEQGQFDNGLKTGLWKTWYPSGVLETKQYWRRGFRKGVFCRYDANGQLTEKGRYSADLKQGAWVNYISKDTVTYKKGQVYVKPVAAEKPEKSKKVKSTGKVTGQSKDNFFSRLFRKKSAEAKADKNKAKKAVENQKIK